MEIRQLTDSSWNPFKVLTTADAVIMNDGQSVEDALDKKVDKVKFKRISGVNFAKLSSAYTPGVIYFIVSTPITPSNIGDVKITKGQIWIAKSATEVELYTNGIKETQIEDGKLVIIDNLGNKNTISLPNNAVNIPLDLFFLEPSESSDIITEIFGSVENFNDICDKIENGASAYVFTLIDPSQYIRFNINEVATGYNPDGRFLMLDDFLYDAGGDNLKGNRHMRIFQQSPTGLSLQLEHILTDVYRIDTRGLENTSSSDEIANRINNDELFKAVESGCIIVDDKDNQIYINNSADGNIISLAASVHWSPSTMITAISIPLIIITKNDEGEMTFASGDHPIMHLYHELGNNSDGSISQKVLTEELNKKVDKVAGKELSTNDYTDEAKSKLQGLLNYDDTIIKNELANKIEFTETSAPSTQDPSDAFATKKFVEEAKKLLFIDMWNEACGGNGRYNEETGFFELININDITYEEALGIFRVSTATLNPPKCNSLKNMFAELYEYQNTYRAFIPPRLNLQNFYNINRLYCYCGELREVVINSYKGEGFNIKKDASVSFKDCYKLTDVFSILYCRESRVDFSSAFIGCLALRNILIKNLQVDIDFKDSPVLSNDSILYMITNSNINEPSTTPFTITLHADAYARAIADTEIQAALAALVDKPSITLISA